MSLPNNEIIEEDVVTEEFITQAPNIEEDIVEEKLAISLPNNELDDVAKEELAAPIENPKTDNSLAKQINDSNIFIAEKPLEIEITNNSATEKNDDNEKNITKPQNIVVSTPAPEDVKIIKKPIKKIYKAVYQEIAGPTLEQIIASLNSRKLHQALKSIVPYNKPLTNYNYAIKPAIINQKKYNIKNTHLDKVFFYKQYFPILYKAIDQANISLIETLNNIIGVNNSVEFKGDKPLLYAIKKGNINVIKKLLLLGYNPDERDKRGNAPIHLAILADRVDIVTELIKAKANIVIPNANNIRPIKLAKQKNNLFIVNILNRVSSDNIDTHSIFSQYLTENQIEKNNLMQNKFSLLKSQIY